MGHPLYRLEGSLTLDGEDVTGLSPDEKARRGMFLAFQYPVAVPGVTVASFLRAAVSARRGAEVPVREFRKELLDKMAQLDMDPAFAGRYLNDGFSGGEKKRLEILQLLMLRPSFALLDETDSGLDIDALKVVAEGINTAAQQDVGMVVVTHYQRLLNYVKPHVVHVFMDGRIVRTGGPELALELEERGYDWLEPVAAAGGA
jgi:Fe-S cluster assembly ATP-binding protein